MTLAAPARPPFVEPTRAGTPLAVYRVRYLAGVAVLVIAAWVLIGAVWPLAQIGRLPDQLIPRLVIGYVLFAGAWFILPGRVSRAALAAVIATASLWIYLNSLAGPGVGLAGGLFGGFGSPLREAGWFVKSLAVAGVVAAWFVVRRRPPLTFTLLPIPVLAFAILLATSRLYAVGPWEMALSPTLRTLRYPIQFQPFFNALYTADRFWDVTLPVVVALLVVIVGSAWIGRVLAPLMRGTDPALKAQRLAAQQAAWQAHANAQAQAHAQADAAWRVAEIKRWEDAYAAAHDGERPPAGGSPPSGPGSPR